MNIGIMSARNAQDLLDDLRARRNTSRKKKRRKRDGPRSYPPRGGGSAEVVIFQFESFSYGLECAACNATVLLEGCGVNVGASITVYDELGCFFDVPEALISGVKGFAMKMKSSDPYDAGCRWVVTYMCCAEG